MLSTTSKQLLTTYPNHSTEKMCLLRQRAEALSLLTDEAVALVAASIGVPRQSAALDFAKGLKDALDVVIR